MLNTPPNNLRISIGPTTANTADNQILLCFLINTLRSAELPEARLLVKQLEIGLANYRDGRQTTVIIATLAVISLLKPHIIAKLRTVFDIGFDKKS